eukprot:356141-Chlamydomonas_euryale.AAC.4
MGSREKAGERKGPPHASRCIRRRDDSTVGEMPARGTSYEMTWPGACGCWQQVGLLRLLIRKPGVAAADQEARGCGCWSAGHWYMYDSCKLAVVMHSAEGRWAAGARARICTCQSLDKS